MNNFVSSKARNNVSIELKHHLCIDGVQSPSVHKKYKDGKTHR